MGPERFDVVVVGAGPAGSVAAIDLVRGGARVALVDKAKFPRDKACGDLVGPRGVQVLEDLEILGDVAPPGTPELGDMTVVGPTGRIVRLPSAPGLTYPGHALAIPRVEFDASLRECALKAGAEAVTARADTAIWEDARLCGFDLDNGTSVAGDFVVGADGATSKVADAAGLVDTDKVLWGFAARSYAEQAVELPTIVFWEPAPWKALPGYGWIFPGPSGRANFGLGVGTLADRRGGAEAVKLLPRFVEHLECLGYLRSDRKDAGARLGGWLKMGMVGTTPAGNGVLLVGDAAGLVNPLQGEGIAHAMTSARAAAKSILSCPGDAVSSYKRRLAAAHVPYLPITATAHRRMLGHPRAIAAAGRLLTARGMGARLAEGWAVFWNELLEGAPPGRARSWALTATKLGRAATSTSTTATWFDEAIGRP